MNNTVTDFSAKEPTLGYFYQFVYSLFRLIKTRNTLSSVRIECLDDIDILEESLNLIQTKLHIKSKADLTDASPDFWKTIRVWIDNIESKRIDVKQTKFTLVTTSKVSENSILKFLTLSEKSTNLFHFSKIKEKLNSIASTSKNTTNLNAYKAFLNFDDKLKENLIENIEIIDSSLNVNDLLVEISHELRLNIVTEKLNLLTERVIGNWMILGVQHLLGKIDKITYKQLHSIILDISNSFKEDNLPNDFIDVISVTDEEALSHETKTFVKQLLLISLKTTSKQVKNAISDFRRAYEQRSRWIREDLINISEEQLFEKELIDKWNSLFGILEDTCENIEDELSLTELCKAFYVDCFVKRVPSIYIKKNFTSEYLTRGSYHLLADKKLIGWHTNFKNLL